ncbi:MAG TPA: Spy/CpxP family protein refolding chaperone [Pseudomonas sp.]|nr:Spy/CpxP family protein refolding chaperone [Pseudomonas sp.]
MRKTLTALLFAAALPTLAIAAPAMDADGPHHMHGDGPRGGHMLHELNLTPEQRQKVGNAMREQMQTRHEILQRYLDKLPAADKAAMKKELDANRDKQQKAIRDTLTPEQQKKFDELQKNLEKRRAEQAEFETWKAERAKKAQ